jgi:hypothetical protein
MAGQGARYVGTTLTDLDTVELIFWIKRNYSQDVSLMFSTDVDESSARKWQLEGQSTVTKQTLKLGALRAD